MHVLEKFSMIISNLIPAPALPPILSLLCPAQPTCGHLHTSLVPDPSLLSDSSVTSCSSTPSHKSHPNTSLHFRARFPLRPSFAPNPPFPQLPLHLIIRPYPDNRFPFRPLPRLLLSRVSSALATLSASPSRQASSRMPSQETCTHRVHRQPPPLVQTLGCIPAQPFPFRPPFTDLPRNPVSHPGIPRSPHSM